MILIKMACGCSQSCPRLWLGFGDNCYRLFDTGLAWAAAETACNQFNVTNCAGVTTIGHLTSIQSSDEHDFLVEYVQSALASSVEAKWKPQVYIGAEVGSSKTNTSWIDGSDFNYTHWYSTDPNNFPNTKSAIAGGRNSKGDWVDVYGLKSFQYMCKLPCSENV